MGLCQEGLRVGCLKEDWRLRGGGGPPKLIPTLAPSLQALFLLSELWESLPNELICLSGSGDKSKEEN